MEGGLDGLPFLAGGLLKKVLTTAELTEQLMKELDLQDRAGKILQVVNQAHENCAKFAEELSGLIPEPERQEVAQIIMSSLRDLTKR